MPQYRSFKLVLPTIRRGPAQTQLPSPCGDHRLSWHCKIVHIGTLIDPMGVHSQEQGLTGSGIPVPAGRGGNSKRTPAPGSSAAATPPSGGRKPRGSPGPTKPSPRTVPGKVLCSSLSPPACLQHCSLENEERAVVFHMVESSFTYGSTSVGPYCSKK